MSNCNSILLEDLSKSQKALSRSQALQDMAASMANEFVVNECTDDSAYMALRHLLIASHHLTANAVADLNSLGFLLKSSKNHITV